MTKIEKLLSIGESNEYSFDSSNTRVSNMIDLNEKTIDRAKRIIKDFESYIYDAKSSERINYLNNNVDILRKVISSLKDYSSDLKKIMNMLNIMNDLKFDLFEKISIEEQKFNLYHLKKIAKLLEEQLEKTNDEFYNFSGDDDSKDINSLARLCAFYRSTHSTYVMQQIMIESDIFNYFNNT